MKNLFASFLKNLRVKKTNIDNRFGKEHKLGQGSMSEVWRVVDRLTKRRVALKVLDYEKTLRLESRFIGLNRPTEGEVAIKLLHPHIVKTLEHGITSKREQFLVMEYVSGVSMPLLIDLQNEVMKKNCLKFIVQIGEALAYFHNQGWIHRDLCPRNILVNKDNNVKLIDFGLVVPNTPKFCAPGNRTGTVSYMAPELIKRRPTDQRLDIYSYAMTCYEMYANRLPYDVDATLTLDLVIQHINSQAEDIRKVVPDIDEQIAVTIMKGLASNPEERWESTDLMLQEFRKAQERLEPDAGEIPEEAESEEKYEYEYEDEDEEYEYDYEFEEYEEDDES